MRRFIPFAIAITVLIGIFATFAYFVDDDWGPDHHDNAQVVQVVPAADGSTGNTIVIEHDHHPFFFPFGFFIFPLFFLCIFFFARALWGPRRWGRSWDGPNFPESTPPAWFDQWHRNAHGQRSEPPAPPAPPSVNDSDATPS